MKMNKQDIEAKCKAITLSCGCPMSTHCENGKYLIAFGSKPHMGKVIFRGTVREASAFLDGLEKGLGFAQLER